MRPDKIYLDTCLLIRWFLWRFDQKKYGREPRIIRFLSETKKYVKSYISIVSVAELVKILKYDDEFKKFEIKTSRIIELIDELQQIIGFDIIRNIVVNNTKVEGVIISKDIIKYVQLHPHLSDCIHVDIAKRYELCFLTIESRTGKLKQLYADIMTEKKFFKQKFNGLPS